MAVMKLSVWAKSQGLSYKTAWRLWKEGKLPVPAEQLLTGTVIVHPPVIPTEGGVALYAGQSRYGVAGIRAPNKRRNR